MQLAPEVAQQACRQALDCSQDDSQHAPFETRAQNGNIVLFVHMSECSFLTDDLIRGVLCRMRLSDAAQQACRQALDCSQDDSQHAPFETRAQNGNIVLFVHMSECWESS